MKSVSGLITTALIFLGCFFVTAWSQDEITHVDRYALFEDPRRPSAIFVHDTHNETADIEECMKCHHLYDDEGNMVEDESSEEQSCSECHEYKKQGNIPSLRSAFHRNCMGCHEARKAGPVMCGECHVR